MAELVAGYVGTENGKYNVNIRDLSAAKGSAGATGLIEKFDTAEDAQAFIEAVNNNQKLKPLEQDGFTRSSAQA